MARQKIRIQNVGWKSHPTRKHGVGRDKYFHIRHTVNGQEVREYIGWATDGWRLEDVVALKKQLFENKRTGESWQTIKQKREMEEAQRQEEAALKRMNERDATTVAQVWSEYFEQAREEKTQRSWTREESLWRLWIKPVIGDMKIKDVAPIHLERIKKNMATSVKGKKGLSPRSIHYALAVIRQVFNYAQRHGIFVGANPVSRVKKPTVDNRRFRFLTRDEADKLLTVLATKSQDVHDQALIALHCGLRAGEIFNLTWQDVDVEKGILTLRDTKNTKTRPAFLTEATRKMLKYRATGGVQREQLVFPARGGGKAVQVSDTFNRAVNEIGLNKGATDARMRVTFHSLRHTFASMLVENGTDLYTVKELLGHSDFKMTARYAHLGQNTLQEAVNRLDKSMQQPGRVLEFQQNGQT